LDVYLNFVTPKCLIIQKLDSINKNLIDYNRKMELLEKENAEIKKNNQELKNKVKSLEEFIENKFPEFNKSK